jgi:tRNA1(Val) A37 N6-methylase TrmN6
LKLGLQRTVSGGFFTAIIRADRLAEALSALPTEGVSVLPLWPKAAEPARRVIVQVRKASRAAFALLPGLVLHQPDGTWTAEAEAVLRRGAALAPPGARL